VIFVPAGMALRSHLHVDGAVMGCIILPKIPVVLDRAASHNDEQVLTKHTSHFLGVRKIKGFAA
jgi:hypothetical protein